MGPVIGRPTFHALSRHDSAAFGPKPTDRRRLEQQAQATGTFCAASKLMLDHLCPPALGAAYILQQAVLLMTVQVIWYVVQTVDAAHMELRQRFWLFSRGVI